MDEYQIEIPPSFTALFLPPGGTRLKVPAGEVRERYELCEDLANMLTEQALARLHELGVTELDVLGKMEQGLAQAGSPVSPAEARWVVRRLAELLRWEDPGPGEVPRPGSNS